MSILIKGMEMPKNCCECILTEWNNGDDVCRFSGISALNIGRQADCPLIDAPVDYEELLKAAKAMHTWIFLHSSDEEMAYKACRLSDEMNTLLGYSGAFTVIPADKDGET